MAHRTLHLTPPSSKQPLQRAVQSVGGLEGGFVVFVVFWVVWPPGMILS